MENFAGVAKKIVNGALNQFAKDNDMNKPKNINPGRG
jgi:hypothetical protein